MYNSEPTYKKLNLMKNDVFYLNEATVQDSVKK